MAHGYVLSVCFGLIASLTILLTCPPCITRFEAVKVNQTQPCRLQDLTGAGRWNTSSTRLPMTQRTQLANSWSVPSGCSQLSQVLPVLCRGRIAAGIQAQVLDLAAILPKGSSATFWSKCHFRRPRTHLISALQPLRRIPIGKALTSELDDQEQLLASICSPWISQRMHHLQSAQHWFSGLVDSTSPCNVQQPVTYLGSWIMKESWPEAQFFSLRSATNPAPYPLVTQQVTGRVDSTPSGAPSTL